MVLAAALERPSAGRSRPARIAMMAITTRSSTSVKAHCAAKFLKTKAAFFTPRISVLFGSGCAGLRLLLDPIKPGSCCRHRLRITLARRVQPVRGRQGAALLQYPAPRPGDGDESARQDGWIELGRSFHREGPRVGPVERWRAIVPERQRHAVERQRSQVRRGIEAYRCHRA